MFFIIKLSKCHVVTKWSSFFPGLLVRLQISILTFSKLIQCTPHYSKSGTSGKLPSSARMQRHRETPRFNQVDKNLVRLGNEKNHSSLEDGRARSIQELEYIFLKSELNVYGSR
ncbi:hypothetical protein CEXT_342331 [Caerostris extrusa]|uniref:Uncharacterized protein n=1 Tax=Caerostris extrusa TaxID=172846 RepID=A0AAV4RYK5_CAEEX|nr:hypothetical protein CEXT_342331 [Caerostris extrusa]